MSDHIQWLVLGNGKVRHGTVRWAKTTLLRAAACKPNAPDWFTAGDGLPKCARCEVVFRAYPEMENPE